MTTTRKTCQIDPQFRGPPGSANGGYTAGLLASVIDGASQITLRAPPPLATEMTLTSDTKSATLEHGDEVIATACAMPLDLQPPPNPGFETALAAREHYAGFKAHNFPGCFVCGPDRAEHDGLRVFAAALGDTTVAAAWQPDGESGDINPLLVHAALDCPSYFALRDTSLVALLGRMHGQVFGLPEARERCVVVGWPIARDGRKSHSGAALYGADDRLLALARNTWIELKN